MQAVEVEVEVEETADDLYNNLDPNADGVLQLDMPEDSGEESEGSAVGYDNIEPAEDGFLIHDEPDAPDGGEHLHVTSLTAGGEDGGGVQDITHLDEYGAWFTKKASKIGKARRRWFVASRQFENVTYYDNSTDNAKPIGQFSFDSIQVRGYCHYSIHVVLTPVRPRRASLFFVCCGLLPPYLPSPPPTHPLW